MESVRLAGKNLEHIQEEKDLNTTKFVGYLVDHLAPISLGLATVLFVITLLLPDTFPVGLLRSFSEAAMIGGLADWFAVTALFKHPLRLPIPHTAIIPNNRERIEQSLESMVNIVLSPERIIAFLKEKDLVKRLIGFLDNETNRKKLLDVVGKALTYVLNSIDVEKLTRGSVEFLKERSQALTISEEVCKYLAANRLNRTSVPEKIFSFIVDTLETFVKSKGASKFLKEMIEELIHKHTLASWLKKFKRLDAQDLSDRLVAELSKQLELEIDGKSNKLRDVYEEVYKNLTLQLDNRDSHTSRTLDSWWSGIAEGEGIRHRVLQYLSREISVAIEDLARDESKIKLRIENFLCRHVEALKINPDLQHRTAEWVNEHVFAIVQDNHGFILETARKTLKEFPTKKLVKLIENRVGKDLQYIRVNGAAVGGLVGAAIYCFKSAIL
jgi:uncharacterized membrane-anchored protein YjiN (DUF445 family)